MTVYAAGFGYVYSRGARRCGIRLWSSEGHASNLWFGFESRLKALAGSDRLASAGVVMQDR